MPIKADATRLAKAVDEAWLRVQQALADKRKYPVAAFTGLFAAVKAYAEATAGETMIHRQVASRVNGLREHLAAERKRVPGNVLHDADRLECMLFSGYDLHFEGDEPPGL